MSHHAIHDPEGRTYRVEVKFTEEEFNHLMELIKQSKLSRESYIRMLVSGVIPRAAPSKELLETTKLLRNIANNINQVARIANRNGSLDTETYQSNYADLLDTIDQIMLMMQAQVKMEELWKLPKYGQ